MTQTNFMVKSGSVIQIIFCGRNKVTGADPASARPPMLRSFCLKAVGHCDPHHLSARSEDLNGDVELAVASSDLVARVGKLV